MASLLASVVSPPAADSFNPSDGNDDYDDVDSYDCW